MATRPTIMPLTAPRNVGFLVLLRNMSHTTQVSKATAVATLVLITAVGRVPAGEVGVTAVEAVPAQPQDAGADGDHGEAVRHEPGAVPGQPGADHPGGHEARRPGGQVDDVAAGVVEGALVGPVAAAPQQHGVDGVDEEAPGRDEDHPHLHLDPAQDAAQEQKRGDGREDELEVGQGGRRHLERDGGADRQPGLAHLGVGTVDRLRVADEVIEEVGEEVPGVLVVVGDWRCRRPAARRIPSCSPTGPRSPARRRSP